MPSVDVVGDGHPHASAVRIGREGVPGHESTAARRVFQVFTAAVPHSSSELQRELIVANTNDGLVSARDHGRVGGRRPRLPEDQAALAQRLYDEREKTVQQIADMFGVPRSTVYGHLDKSKTVPRQPKKSAITKPR